MMIRTLKISLAAIFMLFILSIQAQNSYELNSGWSCAPIKTVKSSGEAISLTSFNINTWKPATVPGTVLTTLLNNGEVPDPFYGMNNEKIADIYYAGNDYYTYWFVRDFSERPKKGELVWLTFRGINYSVDIFINGKKVNEEPYEGMFLRKSFNITDFIADSGNNRLAVLVHPAEYVGNPNGGQGGDGTIAKGVMNQYVAGWDWIQPVRDRNTGIWDKVSIEKTGMVNLRNPHVVTRVKGKRYPGKDQAPAVLEVSAELQNTQSIPVTGMLYYEFNGKTIEKEVSLPAHTTTTVDLPDFEVQDPELWWPSGYGNQKLYNLDLQFKMPNGISDSEKVTFGIREIETRWNDHTRSMQIYVNGQPIFIKGGNWILSDAMLRFSKARYDAEVRFHRDMNLNLIRIWGGSIPERPEFYDACDKYGLLVMQDFAMSGDCNGRWLDPMKKEDQWTRRQYPDDHKLFNNSVADVVKMLRNHPSLAMWCGGNEITPPQDILHAIKDSILPKLDGTRWFIEYSNSDQMSYNFKGGNGDGPYGIQDVNAFWSERSWPFNSEIGSVGTGDARSLKRFLPEKEQVVPVERNDRKQTSNTVWAYHKYIGYGDAINKYGKPGNMEDFAEKAQLVNYNQYRGLMEGFSAHMWDWYTGVIIWKTQNPWTALRGQMYDYYLDPNACLYGLRSGSENLHAMYDPVNGKIMLVNNGFDAQYDLMLRVNVYDMNGNKTLLAQVFSYLEPSSVKPVIFLKDKIDALSSKEGAFLSVQLLNLKKELVSDNFYWLPDADGNFSGLQHMTPVIVEARARQISKNKIELTIENKNQAVSFFNRISLIVKKSKERILPAFYSDNYISILPGDEKRIIIEYAQIDKNELGLEISGWNTAHQYIDLD